MTVLIGLESRWLRNQLPCAPDRSEAAISANQLAHDYLRRLLDDGSPRSPTVRQHVITAFYRGFKNFNRDFKDVCLATLLGNTCRSGAQCRLYQDVTARHQPPVDMDLVAQCRAEDR